MIEVGLIDPIDPVSAPPLSPAARAIDLGHLYRMTLGDRALELDVLRLFERQAEMLLVRMRDAASPAIAAYAHTLKGSAQGIGAWSLAQAADEVETAAHGADHARLMRAIQVLTLSVGEARHMIAEMLRAH